MCVACGEELCKHCKGCHNKECERYTEPTPTCDTKEESQTSYATKGEEKVEKPNYVRRERYEGEMSRTITLPTQIQPEQVLQLGAAEKPYE